MLTLTILDQDVRPKVVPAPTDPGVYVWRDVRGAVCSYGHTVEGRHWMHWPRLASFCFGAGHEVTAIAEPSARREHILDTFQRTVTPFVLQAQGWEALHASAVVMKRGVIAFSAVSETGKSTLAFGLSERGYSHWADDSVLFDVDNGTIRTVPLPFQARLRPDIAAFFQQAPPGRGALPAVDRQEYRPAMPMDALCLLERVRDASGPEIVERPRAKAFAAVLKHAHCFSLQDPDRKKLMVEHYLELTARVPVFDIRFSPSLEQLPKLLDRIVEIFN